MWFLKILIFKVVLCFCHTFKFPEATLEAFEPSGFKVSIPAEPGIELFAFHGNKNVEITQTEPGAFEGEARRPTKDLFVYYDPNVKLKVGDTVYYWLFIQYEQMGYRKDFQTWKVTELKSSTSCNRSLTKVEGQDKICAGKVILDEEFQILGADKWIIDQYIPVEPDYEFTVYRKDSDVVYVENGRLIIRPKIDQSMTRDIDLTNGCTKSSVTVRESLCRQYSRTVRDIKIISGRITSKIHFTFGEVEIKARLPSGDWMYSELFLEEADDSKAFNKKIVIAYARGNQHLYGDGTDIGGTLLFGGPVWSPHEPERSQKLRSYRSTDGFSRNAHVYKITWTPERIELFIDDAKYGSIEWSEVRERGFMLEPMKARLVLGVGVGGITDFPDSFNSSNDITGGYAKPWVNRAAHQELAFWRNQDKWYPTWNDDAKLEVEYVKITAV